MTTEDLLVALFNWWARPQMYPRPSFADDFEHRDLTPRVSDAAEWIWLVEQAPTFLGLELLSVAVDSSVGRLTFHGTEPVTGLFHKTSWVVEFADDQVARVTEDWTTTIPGTT